MCGRGVRCAAVLLSLHVVSSFPGGISLPPAAADEIREPIDRLSPCYASGLETARSDYSGRGAFWGGLAAGAALGPIGYVIGGITLDNCEIDVPAAPPAGVCGVDRESFVTGYAAHVVPKRRRQFRNGAAIGSFVFAIWVALAIPIMD